MVAVMDKPKKRRAGPNQTAATKKIVSDLYCQGYSQMAIADKLKVSQPRISVLLSEIRLEWKAAQLVDTNEKLLIELAKMDKLEQECWIAWEASKSDHMSWMRNKHLPREKKDKDGNYKPRKPDEKMTVTSEVETQDQRCGDPSYLTIIEKCIVTRLKLMGLLSNKQEAANLTQVNINWGDLTKPIPSIEVIDVTPSKSIEDRINSETNEGAPDNVK